MKVCICGGGNLGHVIAGFIAAHGQHEVTILTRHPEQWSHQLQIETPDGTTLMGDLQGVYSDPSQAIPQSDIILLCLPGFSIHQMLQQIGPYIQTHTVVGSVISSTGFFQTAMNQLPATTPLFGFQRVPFIARTIEYGHRAHLMGYKNRLNMAVEHCQQPEPLRLALEDMLRTPVTLLDNFYEACLSNSNPLLHPARLYSLWKDWHEGIIYNHNPMFYEEWTEEASRLYVAMDEEFQALIETLPVKKGSIPTVLDYYESTDAISLTDKLRSIEAFKGIQSPMITLENGYVPDFKSRYFTEDFPYGLALIRQLAKEKGVVTPVMDNVCAWGMKMCMR